MYRRRNKRALGGGDRLTDAGFDTHRTATCSHAPVDGAAAIADGVIRTLL